MVDRSPDEAQSKSPRLWEAGSDLLSTRAMNVAAKLVIVVGIIGILYWAQAIIFPIAVAVLITFVLTPLVASLHRRNWRRLPAVLAVLTSVTLILGGVLYIVGMQLTEFGDDLPQYRDTIKAKMADVRGWYEGGPVEKVDNTIKEVNRELDKEKQEREQKKKKAKAEAKDDSLKYPRLTRFLRDVFGVRENPPDNPLVKANKKAAEQGDGEEANGDQTSTKKAEPIPVQVKPGSSTWADVLTTAQPALAPLATAGLVAVLVLFMLLKYDDLRNRFVTAVGNDHLALTMKALDDATSRISRFLLMQLLINATFGLAVGVGLMFLGVPYGLLWGLCAAVFRYIPFLGPWIAAALPIAISLITFPGWSQVIGVIALFVVLELISNNIMEPWLYGRSVGVSELGILVSAAFWTWLWGPFGLILSTPMTVCLVVLGQHVKPMSIFHKLLGNEPLREPAVNFFQRTLAGDRYDAGEIIEQHIEQHSLAHCFDEVVRPALSTLRHERSRGILNKKDVTQVCELIESILQGVVCERNPDACANEADDRENSATPRFRRAYGCAANDEIDAVGLVALEAVLRSRGRELTILDEELLAAEQVEQIDDGAVICVSTIWPDGDEHAQYLCKRIRDANEHATILLGRWGATKEDVAEEDLRNHVEFVAVRMSELENRLLAEMRVESRESPHEERELVGASVD